MLPKLSKLFLELNKIKTLSSSTFKSNPLLAAICFSSNQLEEFPEDLFDSNPNLVSLEFDRNLLKFARTFGVSYVDLSSNLMRKVKVDPGTKILHIPNNFIESIDCIGTNLTSYQRIFASNNSFTNFNCFRDMENLNDLDVSNNNFQRPVQEVFQKLTKMRDFRIYKQPKFLKVAAKVFSPMKDIIALRIDRFIDYRNLRQIFPEISQIALSTKTWNCSYTKQVSKALERQRILMNYNSVEDRRICNVVQSF